MQTQDLAELSSKHYDLTGTPLKNKLLTLKVGLKDIK